MRIIDLFDSFKFENKKISFSKQTIFKISYTVIEVINLTPFNYYTLSIMLI